MHASGPAPGELSIGSSLGNYTIVSFVGRGGMGAVYQGEHSFLGRKAAIKVLLPEYSQNAELVDRFFKEARATARLRHRAFVEVFDSGSLPGGSSYLIMEMLEGENLAAHIERRERLPAGEAIAIARSIAEGVGYAHRHGIIHRDLKPDNVFLAQSTDSDDAGTIAIKVLDFGIAKLAGSSESMGSATRTGALLGTPHYMAPEQCRGSGRAIIDQRSDVYALGCIVHAMLAGNPPFPFDGFGEILAAHLSEPPPPLRSLGVDVPDDVEALVLRMLAKAADARPASMEEVDEELRQLEARHGLTSGELTLARAAPRPSGAQGVASRTPAPQSASGASARASARTAVFVAPSSSASSPASSRSASPASSSSQVRAGSTRLLTSDVPDRAGTLTGGASERAGRPRRSGRAGLIAAAVGVVAIAGVVIFRLAGDRQVEAPGDQAATRLVEAPPPPPAAVPPAPPVAAAKAPAEAAAAPAPAPLPEAAPSAPIAPTALTERSSAHEREHARVTIGISSTPPGAEVIDLRTGSVVGKTPFQQQLPLKKHDSARFAVRKEGFARKEIKARLDRDADIDVTLDRAPVAAPASPPPAPAPARGEDDDDDRRKL